MQPMYCSRYGLYFLMGILAFATAVPAAGQEIVVGNSNQVTFPSDAPASVYNLTVIPDAIVGQLSGNYVYIANYGGAGGNLSITGVSITGANPTEFQTQYFGETTLAPNASASLLINFAPQGAGFRSATINIASDDSDENPFKINVSATGYQDALPQTPDLRGEFTKDFKAKIDKRTGHTFLNGKIDLYNDGTLNAESGFLDIYLVQNSNFNQTLQLLGSVPFGPVSLPKPGKSPKKCRVKIKNFDVGTLTQGYLFLRYDTATPITHDANYGNNQRALTFSVP